jgi:hypothetical protein
MAAQLEAQIIPPGRGSGIEYISLGAALVGVGVWIMVRESFWYGLVTVIFFSIFVAVGSLMLFGIRPCLRFQTTGLEICTWFRKERCTWTDVERVEVGRVKGAKALFIYLSRDRTQSGWIHRTVRSVGVPDFTIVDVYKLNSNELAELMNQHVSVAKETSERHQVKESSESKTADQ